MSDSCEICRDHHADSPWGFRRTQKTPLFLPEEGAGRRYQLPLCQVVKRRFGCKKKEEDMECMRRKERERETESAVGFTDERVESEGAEGRGGGRCREESEQKRTVVEGEGGVRGRRPKCTHARICAHTYIGTP